jgi:hypothetical protein
MPPRRGARRLAALEGRHHLVREPAQLVDKVNSVAAVPIVVTPFGLLPTSAVTG